MRQAYDIGSDKHWKCVHNNVYTNVQDVEFVHDEMFSKERGKKWQPEGKSIIMLL